MSCDEEQRVAVRRSELQRGAAPSSGEQRLSTTGGAEWRGATLEYDGGAADNREVAYSAGWEPSRGQAEVQGLGGVPCAT